MNNCADVKWETCCRGRKDCPKIGYKDGRLYIKDDYGNIVQIDENQIDGLIEKLNEARE